jgi:hypothetical protein
MKKIEYMFDVLLGYFTYSVSIYFSDEDFYQIEEEVFWDLSREDIVYYKESLIWYYGEDYVQFFDC